MQLWFEKSIFGVKHCKWHILNTSLVAASVVERVVVSESESG